MKIRFTLLLGVLISFNGIAQIKILFDATKAEMCSNADWVIDADTHNIFFSNSTHLPYASSGTGQSNPQRIPTPSQTGITASTVETYWQGALSNWAIDCVNQGYVVETLPFNSQITYGNSANVQDLSNYKVFVVDEPNIQFSASEKAAIVNFVKNGGGLCMISDHSVSDRNNDGWDSPMIWNDLMTTNTVQANPFGIAFDTGTSTGNFSLTSTGIANLPTNPVLHGPKGNVTQVKWSNGTRMTLNTTQNPSVQGLIFKSGTTGTTDVMVAWETYYAGKIVAFGDSSPMEDGSGDPNDSLYNGYTGDANGNHQRVLVNAIVWLASQSLGNATFDNSQTNVVISPNPIRGNELTLYFHSAVSNNATFVIYDSLGRMVKTEAITNEIQTINCSGFTSGVYFGKVISEGNTKTVKFIVE